MADFHKLLVAFITITLFTFLSIGFVTKLADNYGKDTEQLTEELGSEDVTEALNNVNATAEAWKKTFVSTTSGAKEGEEKGVFGSIIGVFADILDIMGLLTVGVFNLLKTMMNFIATPFTIFSTMASNVLGIDPLIMSIIYALITLTIIFGIWSMIKRGA